MNKTSSHDIGNKSLYFVASAVAECDDALFRLMTGTDYGVDALIELFDKGCVTGNIAYVQIKGTEGPIEPLKKTPEVSCSISSSNARYVMQDRIPFIVFYVSIKRPRICYWALLQDVITDDHLEKIEKQESVTIRIPQSQYFESDATPAIERLQLFFRDKS